MNQSLLKQCAAEGIGTFTLIFIGVGAIYNLGSVPGGSLRIALAGLIYGRFLIKESK
jgi:glycerol uptake facilitator-like aquaporin